MGTSTRGNGLLPARAVVRPLRPTDSQSRDRYDVRRALNSLRNVNTYSRIFKYFLYIHVCIFYYSNIKKKKHILLRHSANTFYRISISNDINACKMYAQSRIDYHVLLFCFFFIIVSK